MSAAAYDDAESIDFDLSLLTRERENILLTAETAGRLSIFGYGSLMWRPDFPFRTSYLACVDGYARKWWLGSPDHRGTPAALGRVCTLVASAGARTYGRVYEVAITDAASVLDALFYREKAGYAALHLSVYAVRRPDVAESAGNFDAKLPLVASQTTALPTFGAASDALTFVATSDSPFWAGPSAVDDDSTTARVVDCDAAIATIIATAAGPSGTNYEYFTALVRAHRDSGLHDNELESMRDAVERARRVAEAPLATACT